MLPSNLSVCLLVCFSQTVIISPWKQSTWWISWYPWKDNDRSNGQAQKRQKAPCHANMIQIPNACRAWGAQEGVCECGVACTLAMVPGYRLGTLPVDCSEGFSGLTALPCPLELCVSLLPFKGEAMNRGFLQSSELSLGTSCPAWGVGSSSQHHLLPMALGGPKTTPSRNLSRQVISCFRDSHSLLLKLLHFNHQWLKTNEAVRKVLHDTAQPNRGWGTRWEEQRSVPLSAITVLNNHCRDWSPALCSPKL